MIGYRLARAACLLCVGFASCIGTWAHAQSTRDFSKAEITLHEITGWFCVLDFCGTGSAVSVLTGAHGVLLIDSQFAPLAPRIAATIGTLTDRADARYLIDTHAHGDHVGGNEFFARSGATVIARDEVRDQQLHSMQMPDSPASTAALPVITYEGRLMLHLNGEKIELIAVPSAH